MRTAGPPPKNSCSVSPRWMTLLCSPPPRCPCGLTREGASCTKRAWPTCGVLVAVLYFWNEIFAASALMLLSSAISSKSSAMSCEMRACVAQGAITCSTKRCRSTNCWRRRELSAARRAQRSSMTCLLR
jgi:hypothetical protein